MDSRRGTTANPGADDNDNHKAAGSRSKQEISLWGLVADKSEKDPFSFNLNKSQGILHTRMNILAHRLCGKGKNDDFRPFAVVVFVAIFPQGVAKVANFRRPLPCSVVSPPPPQMD